MIRSYESEFGLSYTWILMVRTDSRWDADFPDVRNLDRNYVHARLRCPGQLSVTSRHLQLGSFVRPTQLTMYMPDILNQTCIPISRSDKVTKFGCACQPWGCQISEQVVDDMAALIPRKHMDAYFSIPQKIDLESIHLLGPFGKALGWSK